MGRPAGPSVRLRLTLSYAGFLLLTGALMLGVAWFVGRGSNISTTIWYLAPQRLVHFVGSFIPGNDGFILRQFAPTAVVVLAFLLVFGLFGGWLLAGRMLAPLDRITAATRTAAGGSLSHRIEMEGRQDEFRELADSFDSMLGRLEAQVAEQRRFAANASHELRTPLAITQTLLDVARTDPNYDSAELFDRLQTVNTRAIELTEALLLLSRTEQRTFTKERVDLSLTAEEAAETLLPLAEKHGVGLQTGGEFTPILGSHALLLQMTTNLLHNAIVHNLPQDGIVRVETMMSADSALLVVANTGAPIPPEVVSTLTEPFRRGAERIRGDYAGTGLGLAIVKSIAQAHDGTVMLTARPTGGLRVTVQLPAAPRKSLQPQTPESRTADRRILALDRG